MQTSSASTQRSLNSISSGKTRIFFPNIVKWRTELLRIRDLLLSINGPLECERMLHCSLSTNTQHLCTVCMQWNVPQMNSSPDSKNPQLAGSTSSHVPRPTSLARARFTTPQPELVDKLASAAKPIKCFLNDTTGGVVVETSASFLARSGITIAKSGSDSQFLWADQDRGSENDEWDENR